MCLHLTHQLHKSTHEDQCTYQREWAQFTWNGGANIEGITAWAYQAEAGEDHCEHVSLLDNLAQIIVVPEHSITVLMVLES